MLRIYDDDGNEVLEHPLFDVLDDFNNTLAAMTKEERYRVFQKMMYRQPLKYMQEIDGTNYIVRTHFNSDGKTRVFDTVNRLMEKTENSQLFRTLKH